MRKLTIMERLLGMAVTHVRPQDEERRDVNYYPVPTHGTETTFSAHKITNGWLVVRSTQNDPGPNQTFFYPDLNSLADGIRAIETAAKLNPRQSVKAYGHTAVATAVAPASPGGYIP